MVILIAREYKDWLLGIKTYVTSKDGTIDILASINDWDMKALQKGSLIYEDDRIVAIDMTSGLVKPTIMIYLIRENCSGILR